MTADVATITSAIRPFVPSCVPLTDAQKKAGLVQLVKSGEVTQEQAAVSVGFCTFKGCWDRINEVQSTFIGQGNYGYGDQSLGTFHMAFTVTTVGFRTMSKPLFAYTTRSTKNSVLSAERLYLRRLPWRQQR